MGEGGLGVSPINNRSPVVMTVVICVFETTVNNPYRSKTIR